MRVTGPTDYLIRQLGMTRLDFTKRHGLGENTMLRLGQGRMPHLSGRMLELFEGLFTEEELRHLLSDRYGTPFLAEAYQNWRQERILEGRGVLPEFVPWQQGLSPAQRFVNAVGSMSKVAQILCVNDYLVRRWTSGAAQSLPEQMRESMQLMQWPFAEELDKEQQRWLGV